jgi:hypothetical protein
MGQQHGAAAGALSVTSASDRSRRGSTRIAGRLPGDHPGTGQRRCRFPQFQDKPDRPLAPPAHGSLARAAAHWRPHTPSRGFVKLDIQDPPICAPGRAGWHGRPRRPEWMICVRRLERGQTIASPGSASPSR